MPNELSSWNIYCDLVKKGEQQWIGIKATSAQINRFAARYRAAKSYRRIELDQYSDKTTEGYSAFCRVVFVWSAFEQYMKIMDKKQYRKLSRNKNGSPYEIDELLMNYGANELAQQINTVDEHLGFYRFLKKHVDKPHSRELDKFINNGETNVSYLASSVRHIFAHGILTPHADGGNPSNAVDICDILCSFLLRVMDEDFTKRVQACK